MPPDSSDQDLYRRCAKGDEAALRQLVDLYQRLLFGISKRMLGNTEDAEDVVTRTFLKAWNGAKSFRGDCSVKAHLCRIAINLCRDQPRLPYEVPLNEGYVSHQRDEKYDRIMLALDQLNRDDRELIVLYYINELEYDEISVSIGISYDVLKTRLVRARKKLREIVELQYV